MPILSIVPRPFVSFVLFCGVIFLGGGFNNNNNDDSSSSSSNGVRLAEGFFFFATKDEHTEGSASSSSSSSYEEDEGILRTEKIEKAPRCKASVLDVSLLRDPCRMDGGGGGVESTEDNHKNNNYNTTEEKAIHRYRSPEEFSLVFPTQYGSFTAECVRSRAPVWADRVYNLARHGYYNRNYFFRVIPGRWVQFGTSGDPALSGVYNYTTGGSSASNNCSVLRPQPPDMPYCMKGRTNNNNNNNDHGGGGGGGSLRGNHSCEGVPVLSNDFGTLSMSTSYREGVEGYPGGVTWNATAELFINTGHGNGPQLDASLFVPICTISETEMEEVVLGFPSFGEVAELGGTGPSLGMLYQDGNGYIESNREWNVSMAVTGTVSVCSGSLSSSSVAKKQKPGEGGREL